MKTPEEHLAEVEKLASPRRMAGILRRGDKFRLQVMLKEGTGYSWHYGPPRDTIIETINDLLLPDGKFTTGYELVFGEGKNQDKKVEELMNWLDNG